MTDPSSLNYAFLDFFRYGKVSECAIGSCRFGLLPGRTRQTRRRPYQSPSSLAAFELSSLLPSSPPSLSRFPAACNRLVVKEKFNVHLTSIDSLREREWYKSKFLRQCTMQQDDKLRQ